MKSELWLLRTESQDREYDFAKEFIYLFMFFFLSHFQFWVDIFPQIRLENLMGHPILFFRYFCKFWPIKCLITTSLNQSDSVNFCKNEPMLIFYEIVLLGT